MKLREDFEQTPLKEELPYRVLLYYFYTPIQDPESLRESQLEFCVSHGILGRIIIATEGINGTISGLTEDCEAYMSYMQSLPEFKGIEFKVEAFHTHTFKKINVRVKPEIVHSGLLEVDPTKRTGIHLESEEFLQLKDQEGVVVLDVRSNYEHKLGKFKNAITLDIEHFRDFPEKVKELDHLKDKKVITYCTGGIKCEKASAYLLENGFNEVYQLHGGIIKHGFDAGGKDFEGKCYVFDNRVVADVNTVNPEIISKCYICENTTDKMVNCANAACNEHVTICPSCLEKYEGACSEECMKAETKRPYNPNGYYTRESNGYNPMVGWKRKKGDKTHTPTDN